MRTILAVALLGTLAGGTAAAPPPNDACANATQIGALPFTASLDVSEATDDLADPAPSCTGATATVWFAYTATKPTTLHLDTQGSDGDPELVAFTGGCATPSRKGVVARVAGDFVPTPLGGTYLFEEHTPSMYGKTVAFTAIVSGGSHASAVFVATLRR
jgi:hypothetical protein